MVGFGREKGGDAVKLWEQVLDCLEHTQGDLSGQELAQRLGVSRNGVWRAVNKLKSMGYEIEAGTNRGYRLVSGSDVLSPENIRRQLGELESSIALEVRDSVDSTNTLVKHLAEQGGREGMVVIAQHQTAGKGRLGRSFYSPKGTGLYLSILLRPKFSAQEALSITTAAAVAVAEAVDQVTGKEGGEAKIKWVNDVYYRYRKVCGILTEASIDFETGGLHYAVLGIGVNLTPPPGGFGPDIAPVAGALFPQAPAPGTKTELAAAILSGFFRYYQDLPRRSYMKEYQRRSLLTGVEITFQEGEALREGLVTGVDDQARLLVRLPGGETKVFSAGEVNIKKDFLARMRGEDQ